MTTIHKTPSETEIANTLSDLKLSPTAPQKPLHKPKSKPVADSWDDDTSDTEPEAPASSTSPRTLPRLGTTADELAMPPQPPPPTPASPTPFDFPSRTNSGASRSRGDSGIGAAESAPGARNLDKRPEKTTAVAGRLIAGALGVRAPRRTEEEREFDRAMRDKERKRRAEEREREKREAEEREQRKKAIWED